MTFETLETNRLMLRKLTSYELSYMFQNYSKNKIIKELGGVSDELYLIELKKYESGYNTGKRPFIKFQLINKTDNEIIGGCGFHNYFIEHKRAEIGYNILKDENKRKGYMSEAIKCIIEYGFETIKLNRIEASTSINNLASINLLTKHNFKQEGILRQHYIKDNEIFDSCFFALLKNEFLN